MIPINPATQPKIAEAPEQQATVLPAPETPGPSIDSLAAPTQETASPSVLTSQPGEYDMNLYRGDTYRWQFKLWQDANKTVPVDLTGTTAKAQIRAHSGASGYASMDCTIIMPNIVDVTLDAENSHIAPDGRWDLQLTGPSGVTTVVAGTVTITDDITDSDLTTGP